MSATVGILGKHPAFGDFISSGFELSLKTRLMEWLDRELSRARDASRGDWEALYDHALPLRFWIGPELLGQSLAGVMIFSRDRVNRRYPLVLAIIGSRIEPPVLDDDQGIYEGLEAFIAEAKPERGGGAASLIEEIVIELDEMPTVGPMLWAHHPDGDLSGMFGAVAGPDLTLAASDRSYWWGPARAGKAAAFLSHRGLPPADALAWLMAGMPAAEEDAAPQRISFEAQGRPEATRPVSREPDQTMPPSDLPEDLPELPMPQPATATDDDGQPAQEGQRT